MAKHPGDTYTIPFPILGVRMIWAARRRPGAWEAAALRLTVLRRAVPFWEAGVSKGARCQGARCREHTAQSMLCADTGCGCDSGVLTVPALGVAQEEDNRVLAASGVKKRGNPIVTVGAPVLVTSGFSFALLKFLNK